MACLVAKGSRRNQTCSGGKFAGVNSVLIANLADIDTAGLVIDPVNGITALPLLGGAEWYEYEFTKDGATASEPLAKTANNSTYYTPTVVMNSDADTNFDVEAFNELGFGRVVAVCTFRTGIRRVYGLNNGLESTEGDLNSGTAAADAYGHSITLVGEEGKRYPNLDPSVVLPVAN